MENTSPPPKKPGIKTTEFWLVLGVNLITPAMAAFEKVEGTTAALIMAGLTGLYAMLRGSLKNLEIRNQ